MYFIIMALTLERNKFHLQFEKKKKSNKISMIITSMRVT